MCQPLPYPRCSSHAQKALERAKQAGDPLRLKEAQDAYSVSPAGIRALIADGLMLEAGLAQAERQALLLAGKSAVLIASSPSLPEVSEGYLERLERSPLSGKWTAYVRSPLPLSSPPVFTLEVKGKPFDVSSAISEIIFI